MNIQDLPPQLLVEIFQYLPFKEQVRNARVSKLFQSISESAITEMKELNANDDLVAYVIKKGLDPFLANCSPKLRRIIVQRRDKDGKDWPKIIVNSLLNFPFPLVVEIKLDRDISTIRYSDLINQCPNLKYLSYHCRNHIICPDGISGLASLEKLQIQTNHGRWADIDFKSGKLIVGLCDNDSLSSIIKVVSNFKEINITEMTVLEIERLDELFKGSPKLELINISIDQHGFDLENLSYFWRLSSLKHLFVNRASITDALFFKIAYHFPELETMNLVGQIGQITEEAATALAALSNLSSFKLVHALFLEEFNREKIFFGAIFEQFSDCENLKELILQQFWFTSASFVKIVRTCKNLATLKIHSVGDVHTPEKAVELLESIADLEDGRRLAINIMDQSYLLGPDGHVGVWDANEVWKISKKLKKKIDLSIGDVAYGFVEEEDNDFEEE